MKHREVPFHRPNLGPQEEAAVAQVMASGWLTSGPQVAAFEEACSTYLGSRFALSVSSCTDGLELALLSLGVGPGDEVITTPLTFVATLASIWRVGAEVKLVDVDPVNGNLDAEKIEAAITPKTKAIMPVHLAGCPAPMKAIKAIADAHGLLLIDDGAHAFETVSDAGKVGAVGDGSAFSFYATKNLTTGEGGLLTLANEEVYERAKRLRLHGIDKDAWQREDGQGFRFYDVPEIGLKANMSDIAAAIGLEQLKRLDSMTKRRQEISKRYDKAFAEIPTIDTPQIPQEGFHARHVYALELTEVSALTQDSLVDALSARGVGTSVHFKPVHLLLGPQKKLRKGIGAFPVAEHYWQTHVSLPIYPAMSDSDVDYVIASVQETCR